MNAIITSLAFAAATALDAITANTTRGRAAKRAALRTWDNGFKKPAMVRHNGAVYFLIHCTAFDAEALAEALALNVYNTTCQFTYAVCESRAGVEIVEGLEEARIESLRETGLLLKETDGKDSTPYEFLLSNTAAGRRVEDA